MASYSEKKAIRDALDIDKEDILGVLEQYPGIALKISLEEGNLQTLLSRFKEIVYEWQLMRNVLQEIADDIENCHSVGQRLCIEHNSKRHKKIKKSLGKLDLEKISGWEGMDE